MRYKECSIVSVFTDEEEKWKVGDYCSGDSKWSQAEYWQKLHMYITSDDNIKEGNWYILKDILLQSDDDSLPIGGPCKKVIASTDNKLMLCGISKMILNEFIKNSFSGEVNVQYHDNSDYNPTIYPDHILAVNDNNEMIIMK